MRLPARRANSAGRGPGATAAVAAAWIVAATLACCPAAAQRAAFETDAMTGFREFAVEIDRAVAARDAGFFTDRARLSSLACVDGPEEIVEPRCVGRPAGTVLRGIWRGWWGHEGVLLSSESARRELQRFLSAADQPTLYAIGDQTGRISDFFGIGDACFAVVTSSAEPAGDLWVLTFELSPGDGGWRTVMMVEVGALANEDWLSDACRVCFAHWERWESPV